MNEIYPVTKEAKEHMQHVDGMSKKKYSTRELVESIVVFFYLGTLVGFVVRVLMEIHK